MLLCCELKLEADGVDMLRLSGIVFERTVKILEHSYIVFFAFQGNIARLPGWEMSLK